MSVVPFRQIDELIHGDLTEAAASFTSPWPANGGYWDDDGFIYCPCYRCGITIKAKAILKDIGSNTYDKSVHRVFCKECDNNLLLQVFFPKDCTNVMEYWNLLKGD